jgi:hypothetical protein
VDFCSLPRHNRRNKSSDVSDTTYSNNVPESTHKSSNTLKSGNDEKSVSSASGSNATSVKELPNTIISLSLKEEVCSKYNLKNTKSKVLRYKTKELQKIKKYIF